MSKKQEHNKKYYEKHSEKIKKAQKKIYEENKEAIIQRSLEYYEKNKKKLEKKIECACSGRYMFKNKAVHLRSNKHRLYLADKQ